MKKNKYPKLFSFINGCYYQTVWDDFENDTEIWKDFISRSNHDSISQLFLEINEFDQCSDEFIFDYLNEINQMGGISFDSIKEAKTFISNLKTFLSDTLM